MTRTESEPKYTKADRGRREIQVPVLYPEFSEVMKVAIESEGHKARVVPVAGPEAVALGKRYVHNDICFPAQLNIGELLLALDRSDKPRKELAVGLSKNCQACRAVQYSALARKALDERGYTDVPIITSGSDPLDRHPGLAFGLRFKLTSMKGLAYIDCLNEMRQRTLPYELERGATLKVHAEAMTRGMAALAKGLRPLLAELDRAIDAFNAIPADRSKPRPVVGIVGEILVNYHPAGNMDVGDWLLRHGMEPRFPPVIEFFRQDVINDAVSAKLGSSRWPVLDALRGGLTRQIYQLHLAPFERRMPRFRYFTHNSDIDDIAANAHGIMDLAFNSGEGWLMPGEIVGMIKDGVGSFVIVQPFGCLPNHISGRGTIKAIRERHPRVQIIALDYDPDVSVANIENRLQMLVMGARELAAEA